MNHLPIVVAWPSLKPPSSYSSEDQQEKDPRDSPSSSPGEAAESEEVILTYILESKGFHPNFPFL